MINETSRALAHAQAEIKILNTALQRIENSCLCERFKTDGFDYGEDHKKLGKPSSGCRWLTPLDIIQAAKTSRMVLEAK